MERELSDPSVSDDRVEHQMVMSILDLNQFCLLQVFSHLDIYEAINFGETCKLLNAVSRLAMIQFKEFVLIDHLIYHGPTGTSWNSRRNLPLRKLLSFVAPYIEVLDARTETVRRNHLLSCRLDPEVMRERAVPLQIFLEFDMPKLKSIIVEYSEHLAFITNRQAIKKLTIFNVSGHDLYNYASGMRSLTQLHLFNIYDNVSISDISLIVDNNPNIEDLCLIAEMPGIRGGALEFPVEFIQKLPQLKQLELTIGNNVEILNSSVQLKQLTKLGLVTRYPCQDGNRFDVFLRKLAEKNTVRSIVLRGVDISNRLFETLASMNLTSLFIENASCYNDFFVYMTRAKFRNLRTLHLFCAPSIDNIILIIERFQSLERLLFSVASRMLDSDTLSQRISQLLTVTSTTRPDMKLQVLEPHGSVTISFRHGNYEIISWPAAIIETSSISSFSEIIFSFLPI